MLDTPRIVESPELTVARISLLIPREEIRVVMGPAIREIYGVLAAQGIAPVGPWLTYHRRRPAETFDLDVCVPIGSPVSESGRVKPGRIAAARVARAIYAGPYERLPDAWGVFAAWIETNELDVRDDLWECYLVGPETTDDPSAWRTELNRPLVD